MKFKVRLVLIFAFGLLVCLSLNSKITAYQFFKTKVVMFGDSLTANGKWNKLFPDIKIVNLGRGGDSTHDMLLRLHYVYKYHPKYCFIMAGLNDIDTHRDQDRIYKDYFSILEKLRQNNITPIILSTLYARDYFDANHQINNKIDLLNSTLKDYARTNKITYIELNESFAQNHSLSPQFAFDHVHINDKAYEIWRDKIKNIIYDKHRA